MTEKQLQTKIIKELKERNIWYTKTINVSRAGCPDIIACIEGRLVGIEVKSEKGKSTALQRKNLDEINYNGGVGIIIRPKEVAGDWGTRINFTEGGSYEATYNNGNYDEEERHFTKVSFMSNAWKSPLEHILTVVESVR